MGPLAIAGIVVGAIVMLLAAQVIHLSSVLRWEDRESRGLGYYGRSLADRRRFKARLRRHAIILAPILRLAGRASKMDFRKASFSYQGVAGPLGSAGPDTFARGAAYRPRPEDVFVVTQMKCGTTWMQHLVYQLVLRGRGDLVETGTALYAVAPWLEGLRSVPIEEAAPIGTERPTRIIKTHFPAQLCPNDPAAKYLYVVRHPVSCFASCVDFVATTAGVMAPTLAATEAWFISPELMWWGTWPDHVAGWWRRAQAEPNVLFVSFEDMKRDLAAVARRVADFLGLAPLSDPELARVVETCGFDYMQRHQEMFEMYPPHILQTNAEIFVRGTADRHADLPADVRRRVADWSVDKMAGSDFPLTARYPDLARPTSG